jgi:plasmid stabilization system protein ParE
MPRLIWSPGALRDVQRLYRFLSDKDAGAAKLAVKAKREGVRTIARQPGIGRPVEDLEPQYREWLVDFGATGYVVVCRKPPHRRVIIHFGVLNFRMLQ